MSELNPVIFGIQCEYHHTPVSSGNANPVRFIIQYITGERIVIIIRSRINHSGISAGIAAPMCDGSSIHSLVSQNPQMKFLRVNEHCPVEDAMMNPIVHQIR